MSEPLTEEEMLRIERDNATETPFDWDGAPPYERRLPRQGLVSVNEVLALCATIRAFQADLSFQIEVGKKLGREFHDEVEKNEKLQAERDDLKAWKDTTLDLHHSPIGRQLNDGCQNNPCYVREGPAKGMHTNGNCQCGRRALILALQRSRAERDRMRAALEKYANRGSWTPSEAISPTVEPCFDAFDSTYHGWEIAEEALKEEAPHEP